jgi:hypothetical protein
MGKGGCSFGSFFLRQENEHNLLLLFEKKRIFHLPTAISPYPYGYPNFQKAKPRFAKKPFTLNPEP